MTKLHGTELRELVTLQVSVDDMIDVKEMYQRINSEFYTNRLPYSSYQEDSKIWERYHQESQRLNFLFKEDALISVGLKNHPKRYDIFNLAWQYGHANGLHDVFSYLQDLSNLFIKE